MKHLLALLALTLTPLATAHDLARDGQIAALLHIAPDDEPHVGQSTRVGLTLRQLGGRALTLQDCACQLLVEGPDLRVPLALTRDGTVMGTTVTFPQVGPYSLTLTGTVQGRPFTLRWTVRAQR